VAIGKIYKVESLEKKKSQEINIRKMGRIRGES